MSPQAIVGPSTTGVVFGELVPLGRMPAADSVARRMLSLCPDIARSTFSIMEPLAPCVVRELAAPLGMLRVMMDHLGRT
jgi:hypothetical protein